MMTYDSLCVYATSSIDFNREHDESEILVERKKRSIELYVI
jgi:hypothetical protein